jgi:hypothetical protein
VEVEIATVFVAVQPIDDVAVTVYTPAHKLVAVGVA